MVMDVVRLADLGPPTAWRGVDVVESARPGEEDKPMLVETLLTARRQSPETMAVADATRRFTYRQLTDLSAVMRRIIQTQTTCERVGIMLPSSAAFPAVLFGTLWASKIAIPLNFLLSADELTTVIEDADIDVVITVRHFADLVEKLPVRAVYLESLPLKRNMVLRRVLPLPGAPKVGENDTAVILYTSGTTAAPKGVELSHGNLYADGVAALEALQLRAPQTFLNILPPFHVFGLTANVLIPVAIGASVFSIPRFSPVAVIKALRQEGITVILAIPSMYAALLRTKSTSAETFSTIKLAISGGEPLSETVREGYESRFGVILREGYGMTETSPVISAGSLTAYRAGTVGKPLPGIHLRIVDATGNEVAAGEDGEILVSGPTVMKGYFRKPEETRAAFTDDGWLMTGDVGRLDADGFLSITGRAKEMLIIGGENVFPREIEAVLERHEAVLQAAVIGLQDDLRGEVPVAFVIPKPDTTPTEAELKSFAKASLAGFKVPRQIRVSGELPTGPTGKILKRQLPALL